MRQTWKRYAATASVAYCLASAGFAADVVRQGAGTAIHFKEERTVAESGSRALTASLVLAAVAAVALLWIKRRDPARLSRTANPISGGLRVVESTRVGTARLWVVEFEGERLLLGQSGNTVTLLATRPSASGPGANNED